MEGMVVAIVTLVIASVLGSGVLFRHQRVLTLIAAAGAMWQGQWLLLTLLDRMWLRSIDTNMVYWIGATVLLLPWLGLIKKWSWPYKKPGSGRRDFVVLIILIGVLGASYLVQSRNGFIDGEWVAHGFYNGDTMTMISLTQRSMLTDGLVRENPFAGGGYLEYPTLWHAGIAALIVGVGLDMEWMHYLEILTYIQILMVVPMFFLLMDCVWPEPERKEEKWLGVSSRMLVLIAQALLVGYVMAVSWDNYIYPQTHFFLTGMFLLIVSLLVKAGKSSGWKECGYLTTSGVVSLLLLMSNAVTGAVAVAITIVYYGWRLLDAKQEINRRVLFLMGVAAWLLVYMVFSSGDAVFGLPHFSYTSAESIMRLGPVVLALGVALLLRGKAGWLDLAIVATFAMTVITFLLSQRDIVVANSERFVYHGLLIGFPILLAPMVQAYYWLRRRIIWQSSGLVEKTVSVSASVAIVLLVVMPVLISGARAHDHLMFQDEQVIDFFYREALDYLRQNAGVGDIILTDPEAPWVVPMFTGLSMLRANYWLGVEDEVFRDVQLAFRGNTQAQERSLQRSDYMLIKQDETNKWKLDKYEQVFRSDQYEVYKTDRGDWSD